MSATFFPIENLLKTMENALGFSIDANILQKIDLAQRDHISVGFKAGIIRIILENIDGDVEKNDVQSNSYSQWVASLIANDRNLQSFLMLNQSGYEEGSIFFI